MALELNEAATTSSPQGKPTEVEACDLHIPEIDPPVQPQDVCTISRHPGLSSCATTYLEKHTGLNLTLNELVPHWELNQTHAVDAMLSKLAMSRPELAKRGVLADMLDLLCPEHYGLETNWTWMPSAGQGAGSPSAVVLNCEMELHEIISVHLLDVWSGRVLYDFYVEQSSPLDSGNRGGDIRRTDPLSHIQMDLARILTSQTYIAGFGICEALRALRIAHSRVIDLMHLDGLPESIRGCKLEEAGCIKFVKELMLSKVQAN